MAKLWLRVSIGLAFALSSVPLGRAQESARSWPKDTNTYTRPAVPADAAAPPAAPSVPTTNTHLMRVYDVIINNTDPNLRFNDTIGGSETSIAIDPNNRNQIVITAFSGAWGSFAPLWLSRDGGQSWTKEFTIGAPAGVNNAGCPCDQTFDYGVNFANGNPLFTNLFGSILDADGNIYTGNIFDPSLQGNWTYQFDTATNASQTTNRVAVSIGKADQPWMVRSRVTGSATTDQVQPTNWVIAGTGDFNADGRSDILWRDNNSGGVAMWLMSGATVIASLGVGNVPSDWQIQGVNAD